MKTVGEKGDRGSVPSIDEVAWSTRLTELNPWASGLDLESDEFKAARRNACVCRWTGGKEVWNGWAEAMLTLRAEAEALSLIPVLVQHSHEPTSPLHARYWGHAVADFSGLCFPGEISFEGFVFPGTVDFTFLVIGEKQRSPGAAVFDEAVFSGGDALFNQTEFNGGHVWFNRVQFIGGGASFYETRFNGGGVWFDGSHFGEGVAIFDKAHFSGDASFYLTNFSGEDVSFRGAQFGGNAWFSRADFQCDSIIFQNCYFAKGAFFHMPANTAAPLIFEGDVHFNQAEFDGQVTFAGSHFRKAADFSSIRSKRSFSLANTAFEQTPDFIEAEFHEPPRLDYVIIPCSITTRSSFNGDPRPWPFHRFRIAADWDEHARYRSLRRMAAAGADHENEYRFNGYEIAARRFWKDKPCPLRQSARFWFGYLYQFFSNYGQSIFRPVGWEVGLITLFALIFFATAQPSWRTPDASCHPTYTADLSSPPTNKLTESLAASIHSALIFDRTDASKRTYGCLYGLQGDKPAVMPFDIGLLSTIESILSTVLLFLLGLGLRNMFRIG